ncbi:MAG TPA: hypothetical protein VFU46_13130, partial [Gemmatimonadales bacterium]|nr:hypothetical protein [Gemmatimonadales bacterium]
ATPSGGMAPVATDPLVSGLTQADVRRGHPLRVAAVFAAASAVVLGIVAFLTYRLGLPDWVLWGAGVLLLIGLPIMLATGLHERRRAVARTTAVAITPVETGVSRWLTWRKALLGGALAFGGLTVLAAAYTAMRLLGIGPVGTLVASGALDERDRLILAGFENRTADSTLGPSLTEALRVDLSQSPALRLVDAADIADALRRMQRPVGETLTGDLAREVAERSGVKAVVVGQIDPVGSGYVLSASLLSAAEGRVLTAVRETADGPGALLDAIDRLSGKLRERIGESLVTIRANPPLEQVTTASLAALRKYSDGNRLVDLDRPEEAIPVLEEAIGLDSGFAMAYRKLAVAIENADAGRSRSVAAVMQAYRRRDRLPEVERELATAFYHATVDADPAREAAAYRAVLNRDPDNGTALNNLALLLTAERRYAEAESLAVRAQGTGSAASFFFHGFNAQVLQGRLEDARATVERALRALPPEAPAQLDFSGLLALGNRDLAGAERSFRELRQAQRGSGDWRRRTGDALGRIAETRGRLDEAARYHRENMEVSESRGLPQDYLSSAAQLALLELRYRNRPAEALAGLQSALATHPLDAMAPEDRPYLLLAQAYAAAGKAEQARRTLREYETAVPAGLRRGDRGAGLAYGRVLEAEGNLREAADAYRDAHERMGLCGNCGLFELAGVYDRRGQPDSARILLERIVATPSIIARFASEPYALAPSYKRLGELYEARGDRKRAADSYAKFVDLWKDADPELQPGVREVRQRLGRLAQEPGS